MKRIGIVLMAALALGVVGTTAQAVTNTNAVAKTTAAKSVKIGHIVFEGGDGSSMEQAVVIKHARNEEQGVDAEAKWIKKVHPGWQKGEQSLLSHKDKSYDRIAYATPDGKTMTIFFDITDFFGK
jgi:hypothetical protein